MEAKIAIIAPFPGMQRVAEEVVQERIDEWPGGIQVMLGDLGAGLEEAFKAIREGTEVLISRGGTASLISSQVETPVVEIQVTAFDILRALKQVSELTGTVGVVGFRNVIYGCEDFGDIWGVEIKELTLENEGDATAKIESAARQGIRVIIGDAISVKLAMRYGLEGILIQSGKEAIYKAIKQARLIAGVRRKEQERFELFHTIIHSSTDGIVAVDEKSRITVFNPVAEEMFQILASAAIGRNVGDVITENSQIPIISIGAGIHCDGQLLIVHDMLGFFDKFTPKFVKKYANLNATLLDVFTQYKKEVEERSFPAPEHCYGMPAEEIERLREMLSSYRP